MWTPQSSESSSHLQPQTAPLTSDRSIQPESALWVESPCLDYTKVEAGDSIDCDDGTSAHLSWFQAHDETDLLRGTTTLTAHTDVFDTPAINGDVPRHQHQHYDVDASYASSVEERLQQRLPETPNCDDLQTNLDQHQQQPHQQVSPASQTANLTDKPTSEATTPKRSGATLTLEELKLFSGAAPSPLTYKGRRLRHIAPKSTTSIIADAAVTHQTTQYHHSLLPKTMFSVLVGGPVTTTTTSAFSATAIKPDKVDQQLSPTGKTDFTCPVCALKLNLTLPHTHNNVLF